MTFKSKLSASPEIIIFLDRSFSTMIIWENIQGHGLPYLMNYSYIDSYGYFSF